ncbi:MAG: 4-(cytidine 5'-diphospho)-2-C-methyl-D-erythritol kinase [Chlamydiales bacterium]
MLTFFSPAKINFFLHVIGKRPDGYHDIVSLLHTVSFGDYITFTPSQTDQFTVEGNKKIPIDNSNLIIQARELFRSKTSWTEPLHIHLQKNIPIGSGLGGGSSNAATTLWALNHISKRGISKNELQKWSAKLGSDVPFFFSNGSAVCTGRGEIVKNTPAIIEQEIYLILNDENINTAKVFSHVVPSNETIDIPKLIAETLEKKYLGINELEKAACKAYPSLCDRKKDISDHFTGLIFMTGSGGSFVGIGKAKKILYGQHQLIQTRCIKKAQNNWYTY